MRPLALSVLVGSVVLGCGSRTDLFGSAGSTLEDAGTVADTTATPEAGSSVDATATVDGGATVGDSSIIDEAVGAVCYVPSNASLAGSGCAVLLPPASACGAAEYEVSCGGNAVAVADATANPGPVQPDDRCVSRSDLSSGGAFCCPCEAADAGAASACVNVDVSTYDRSCSTDSDCIPVASGWICSAGCACTDSTINVDGQRRYQQTLAQLPSTDDHCQCANEFATKCLQGVCAYCRPGTAGCYPPGLPSTASE